MFFSTVISIRVSLIISMASSISCVLTSSLNRATSEGRLCELEIPDWLS